MSKLDQLAELGQAIWLDYIHRDFMESGELQRWIAQGLRGMTSNPSIFEQAIGAGDSYAADLRRYAEEGQTANEIYTELAVADIQRAADLLRPVYDASDGADGFVSLEVNPTLAHDTAATLAEARDLWRRVDRPNLMIKIPATLAGLPAISQALYEGINVNITLIFSLARYGEVMAAYIDGLTMRLKTGQPVDRVASVASFFVSRVDSKVDQRLQALDPANAARAEVIENLLGQAAIANARLAYAQFKTVFLGETFAELRAAGARVQRPLWASTSTKNPDYSDIMYVQELIGPHTVNTLPQDTLEAFLDHGEVRLTLEENLDKARWTQQALADLGISMEEVTSELETEGVEKFAASFRALIATVQEQRAAVAGGNQPVIAGEYNLLDLSPALSELKDENILERLWQRDYRVWKPQPTEISNRLGWLDIAERMSQRTARIEALAAAARAAGYTHALLLGMGGSSLAPELFAQTFADAEGLQVYVLDSTDPRAVRALQDKLDPAKTLFIVSTKSGGTVETLSFFKFFYNWTADTLGKKQAGEHFVAITDPGSKLETLAEDFEFRDVYLNDPDIGGRYSALSYFGLVPAALSGVNVSRLLGRAQAMAEACGPQVPVSENPAARLGALLGASARAGRDKATFILPARLASFGDWVEQLIAESLGKENTGVLPVVGEPLGAPALYGEDRLFFAFELAGETNDPAVDDLADSGEPLLTLCLADRYDIGGQMLLWELATAIAGYFLEVNPFDQPNVESAKKRAQAMTSAYLETGALPAEAPQTVTDGIEIYAPPELAAQLAGAGAGKALELFLENACPGDYLALQAFLEPSPENAAALQTLRRALLERYRLATTLGFGPRFLHSTGQLHKGDAGNGLFIQFSDAPADDADLPIPDQAGEDDSSMTFGVLKLAQALGDRQALLDNQRRLIRFHFTGAAAEGLRKLAAALG